MRSLFFSTAAKSIINLFLNFHSATQETATKSHIKTGMLMSGVRKIVLSARSVLGAKVDFLTVSHSRVQVLMVSEIEYKVHKLDKGNHCSSQEFLIRQCRCLYNAATMCVKNKLYQTALHTF
jgi:hypothetical protein